MFLQVMKLESWNHCLCSIASKEHKQVPPLNLLDNIGSWRSREVTSSPHANACFPFIKKTHLINWHESINICNFLNSKQHCLVVVLKRNEAFLFHFTGGSCIYIITFRWDWIADISTSVTPQKQTIYKHVKALCCKSYSLEQ